MHLPSTKDLRAFELAARLGSIKAAADELHVSASALSRRIQSLEEELGQTLFIRDARGLTLTETGRSYAEELRAVFRSLEEATVSARKQQRLRLKVMVPSAILTAIMPNLPSFEQHVPDVDLELHEYVARTPEDLSANDIDVVFSWGMGNWAGWKSYHLNPNCHLVPLCGPALLPDGRLLSTEELVEHTWIIAIPFEDGWKRWFDALGEPLPKPAKVIKVTSGMMAVEVAAQNRGILMGNCFSGQPPMVVRAGVLTPAHAFHARAPGFGHHLHIHEDNLNPAVPQFTRWFFEELWTPAMGARYLQALQQRQKT